MYFPTIKTSYGAYNYIYSEGIQFIPTPSFNPDLLNSRLFNHKLLNPMGLKSSWLNGLGLISQGLKCPGSNR
jgi:hypothetical protein